MCIFKKYIFKWPFLSDLFTNIIDRTLWTEEQVLIGKL